MNNKNTVTILMIATVIIAIIGGTFAYWNWQSTQGQRTNVTFTVASGFTCGADGGGDITNADVTLAPAACTNPEYAIKRTVTVSTTQDQGKAISLDMWLKVNNIGSGLSQSENFKYALTTNSNSCTTDVITTGTFNGTSNGSEVPLLNGKEYEQTTSNDTYYLYIWLDAAETSQTTMNQPFNITIEGTCTDELGSGPAPNAPVLDSGMIPVTIANDGAVTTVASNNPSWYDYDNKQWANAVLVKESGVRTRAANSVAGTVIDQSDILAYYVWIPRYSYKIWTLDASQTHTGDEQTIDIKFVGTNTKETGSAVGEYYTHPAFTFGSEELPGFWVGKFEATGDATTPTILPNVAALTSQNVSTQFATSLKFAGGTQSGSAVTFAGNNTYGVTSTADSHMMKNSEWGAVAYLSHSNYGINDEIRINNYWNNDQTLTGCGASIDNVTESPLSGIAYGNASIYPQSTTKKNNGIVTKLLSPGGDVEVACGIAYGSATSYPQSTTGNISGIFDMSGGALENVMEHLGDTLSSDDSQASSFTTLPASKYIDIYPSDIFTGNESTNITFCTLATCGGHALYETANWYGDYALFVYSYYPWLYRGGGSHDGVGAGAWSFYFYHGYGSNYNSWRGVLVAR